MKNNNIEKKYNAFKDGYFLIALVIGVIMIGSYLPKAIALGSIYYLRHVLIFTLSWTGWIALNKGRTGSFIIGFLIAALLISFIY